MITKVEIKNKISEEELKMLNYFNSIDKLVELKEIVVKKVKNKAIKPMRAYNKNTIIKLYNNHNVKIETVNLLKQCNMTLKNIHKLIKDKSIIDANTLLRSCFENLTMAMVVNDDDAVYKEFINLNITDQTRSKTKPQHIRNEFRKVLKSTNLDLINNISNTQLKKMFDEFYDKSCLFTHSTLIVNSVVETQKNNLDDVYIFAIKLNTYFLEILLYICLKHLNKSTKYINFTYILIGFFVLLSEINKDKLNQNNIKKIQDFCFFDLNKEYFNKSQKEVNIVKEQVMELQKMIEDNPMFIINTLIDIIK